MLFGVKAPYFHPCVATEPKGTLRGPSMALDLQNLPGEGKADGRENRLEGRVRGHPKGLEGACGAGAPQKSGSTSSEAG